MDSFARALAGGGLSRRQTLKSALAMVGGAAFVSPLWSWTGVAQAFRSRARSCPPGHAACGGVCCPAHEACVRPKPTVRNPHPKPRCQCLAPNKLCSTGCKAVRSDPVNCGTCGHKCPVPKGGVATCVAGVCHEHCSVAGRTVCGGVCVNLQTSPTNCGTCGHHCATGDVCSKGACVPTCPTGETKCGASCVNLHADPENCGTCGHQCPAPTGGTATCVAGQCSTSCPQGTPDLCGTTCVNKQTDLNNCGTCGNPCVTGQACCGGTCTSVSTASNCGACGVSCVGAAAGGACVGGQCGCNNDNDCAGGSFCSGGTCVTDKTQGQPCTAPDQCASGFCVGGICCGTACSGPCLTCAGGTCVPVQAGVACGPNEICDGSGNCGRPNGATCTTGTDCLSGNCITDDSNPSAKVCCAVACSATPQSTCGNDGNSLHDGSGCADWSNSTQCRAAFCTDGPSNSTATSAALCNGAGTCPQPVQASCGNFKCGGTVCKTNCSSDNDCISSAFCSGSVCMPRQGAGTTCSSNDACISGTCFGAHCCGNGVTCNTADATCGAIACDSIGNCVYPGAGTSCGSTCSNGMQTVSTCNGSGTCVSGSSTPCPSNLGCSGSGCATSCTPGTSTSCANPATSTCNPAGTACLLNSGQTCQVGSQCLSNNCVGGLCQ